MAKKKSSKGQAGAGGGGKRGEPERRRCAPTRRGDRLVALAEIEFGSLSRGERVLVRRFTSGRWTDLAKLNEPDRAVRPGLVRWLCVSRKAHKLGDPAGVRLQNATIGGAIDLNAAEVPFPVRLRRCTIDGPFECRGAGLRVLDLQGSSFAGLAGDSVSARGDVWLRNTRSVNGEVRLVGATVGGTLTCTGGTFENKGGDALSFDGATINGSVFLNGGFRAIGKVRMHGATVGGALECINGTFKNKGGDALSVDNAQISADVFLSSGFRAVGRVRMLGAAVGGTLTCTGGTFENEGGDALSFDNAQISETVFLNSGFKAAGEVRMVVATVGGALVCINGTFENEGGDALSFDNAQISANVFFNSGFRAVGKVRMHSATIGGNLECTGGIFENKGGQALLLQSARVKDRLRLVGMTSCTGGINLAGCRVGELVDRETPWPDRVRLGGFVYGAIDHDSLGDLESRQAWLAKHDTAIGNAPFDPQPYRQLADVLRRQGHERFANEIMFTASKKQATAELNRMVVRARDGWSTARERLGVAEPKVRDRLAAIGWGFKIAWRWFMRGTMGVWYFLLRILVGHGYRRGLPLLWMLLIVGIGSITFSAGQSGAMFGDGVTDPKWMQPTQGLAVKAQEALNSDDTSPDAEKAKAEAAWVDEYPAFRPIAYSADAFLPLVNLHQETYWTPSNWFVKSVYLPFHIISGWVVTTLAAVSFTGLVRQEGK